jgi:hypothetical protein
MKHRLNNPNFKQRLTFHRQVAGSNVCYLTQYKCLYFSLNLNTTCSLQPLFSRSYEWLLKTGFIVWWIILYKRKLKFVLFNDASRVHWFTYLIIGYWTSNIWSFWHMSFRGNPLLPHRLLFLISTKGSFICTFPPTRQHIPWPLNQLWTTGWNGK